MATGNGAIAGPSGDNGGCNVFPNAEREMINFGDIVTGDSLHATSQSQSLPGESTIDMEKQDQEQDQLGADHSNNGMPPTTTTTLDLSLTTTKSSRKTIPRAKQHLLANKDFFLKANSMTVFEGDPNTMLQGYVLECPNKNANNGRYRIDWQHNTVIPPTINPTCCRNGFLAAKVFALC